MRFDCILGDAVKLLDSQMLFDPFEDTLLIREMRRMVASATKAVQVLDDADTPAKRKS